MKNFKTFVEAVDKNMVIELKSYIENDGDLYNQTKYKRIGFY